MSGVSQAQAPSNPLLGQLIVCPDGRVQPCDAGFACAGEAYAAISIANNFVDCTASRTKVATACAPYGEILTHQAVGWGWEVDPFRLPQWISVGLCQPPQFRTREWLVNPTSPSAFDFQTQWGPRPAYPAGGALDSLKMHVAINRPSNPSVQSCFIEGRCEIRKIFRLDYTDFEYDCPWRIDHASPCCNPTDIVHELYSADQIYAGWVLLRPWNGNPAYGYCQVAQPNLSEAERVNLCVAASEDEPWGYVYFQATLPYRPTDAEMAVIHQGSNLFKPAWAPYWNAASAQTWLGLTVSIIEDSFIYKGPPYEYAGWLYRTQLVGNGTHPPLVHDGLQSLRAQTNVDVSYTRFGWRFPHNDGVLCENNGDANGTTIAPQQRTCVISQVGL